jgi:hypothetical protein
MYLLPHTPALVKFIYRAMGIVQFSLTDSENKCTKVYQRVWCVPFYSFFIYICISYNTSSHDYVSVFELIDKFTNVENILYTTACCFYFYQRSSSLKSLLIQTNSVKYDFMTMPNRNIQFDWFILGLVALLISNFALIPFMSTDSLFLIYTYFPLILTCFDSMFLNDIMKQLSLKFEMINNNFQQQIESSSLSKIFPLAKTQQIEVLEKNELDFKIQRIQKLSHLHYDLVNLAEEICKNFEITIIVSLLCWFENVIETVYYIVFITVNGTGTTFNFVINGIYLLYGFYWLFVLVGIFSGVQDKANNTVSLVHDIWNKYAMSGKINKKIRHLQLVSVRLLNTRLQFTARDYFNLDWTFCHMVIINFCFNISSIFFSDDSSSYHLRSNTHPVSHLV